MTFCRRYRIMYGQNLLLAPRHTVRPDRTHNGKVVSPRSNLRWCSDGFVPLGTSPCDALPVGGSPAGTATSCAAPLPSTPTTVSVVRRRERRHQRLGRARYDAGGGGGAVRRLSRAAPGRNAQRQWFAVDRQRHPQLRLPTRPEAVLPAGEEPAEQWHIRGVRRYTEAGLREHHPAARRCHRPRIDRRMVRGLQCKPPVLGAEKALATRVHRSPKSLSVR